MRLLEFFQNTSFSSAWRRITALVLLLAIGSFFTHTLITLHQKSVSIREERAKKESELSLLIAERERLQREIDHLKQQSALEREVKARLNFKKEGEEVVVVVPDEERSAAASVGEAVIDGRPWYQRVINLIRDAFGSRDR